MNTDYLEKLRKINFDRFSLFGARHIWRERGEEGLGEYINNTKTTTFKDFNQLDGDDRYLKTKALIKAFEAEDNVKRIGDISGKGYGFDPIVNYHPNYSNFPQKLLQQIELESKTINYIHLKRNLKGSDH